MDILNKIEELRKQNNWSIYKLSIESGITMSTTTNMFARKTLPSITTLTAICEAFGITLSQFFASEDFGTVVSEDENELLNNYRKLSERNKQAINQLCKNLV